MDSTSVAKLLRERRVKLGISQSDLAKLLGYSNPQYVSNWERGLCSPPWGKIRRLLAELELHQSEFIEVYMDDYKRVLKKQLGIGARN